MIEFYATTGDVLALEEATRLAEYHIEHTINADGSLAEGAGGHTQSYLNTVRGLLMFASLSGRDEFNEPLHNTCKHAIAPIDHAVGIRDR